MRTFFMKKRSLAIPVFFLILLFGMAAASSVSAYSIEDLDLQKKGDIILGPGKAEFRVDPGESRSQELMITNRAGGDRAFKVEVVDFKGSTEPGEVIDFSPEEKTPYSLKDYLHLEMEEFVLSHGERIRLEVSLEIPEDVEPGGLYGAVMVSASETDSGTAGAEEGKAKGQMRIISRLASLFFVRVKGEALEQGRLLEFKALKSFYEKGPVHFSILFGNEGNVHLSPYGFIEIKNIFGKTVKKIKVDPWFVMPDSLRTREIEWSGERLLFGRYTAKLSLNRGYKNMVDYGNFSFWVIPWKIVGGVVLVLILISWFIVWIGGRFEIRKKEKI